MYACDQFWPSSMTSMLIYQCHDEKHLVHFGGYAAMEYDLRILANYDSTLTMNLERLVHYLVNI